MHRCIRNTTKNMRSICERIGRCPFGVFPSGDCRQATFVDHRKREDVALDFWHACKAQDARLAATEYLWRRPGSPTMKERRIIPTDAESG